MLNFFKRIAISALILVAFSPLLAAEAAEQTMRRPNTLEGYGWHEGDSILTIPSWVKQIPPFTFAGVRGLRRINFAPGSECVKVCQFAFVECVDLETIELPNGVDTFEEGCFRDCHSLRSLRVGVNTWRLPREFAANCEALISVTLPKNIREIGPGAFSGCSSLSRVESQERVQSPEPRAESLESPTVGPANWEPTFTNLRKVAINAFSRCAALTEFWLPDCCELVDSYAFSDCTNLRRVRLPGNSKMLGELIFSGCCNLTLIIEPSPKPPSFDCESFPFEPYDTAAYTRCRLEVPEGSEHLYKIYHGWELFYRDK